MSQQIDFIGGLPEPEPRKFKDVANLRPTIAEEKAELVLRIGTLCRKPPASVASGSLQATREWVAAMKSAMAVAKKVRASVPELTAAVSSMERFK